jgi:folate-binding protein YgfZ
MSELSPLHDVTAQAGAVFVDDAGWRMPGHYGDAAADYHQARDGAAVFDVSHRGKAEVAGADARTFLHNLCTNDIKGLASGAGCEAFFATAQARAVAHALIYHLTLPDGRPGFWLDVVPGLADKLLKHLDRYLISEQVEFADRTCEYAQLHLAGPAAPGIIGDGARELAPLHHAWHALAGVRCHVRRTDPLGVPGFDVICPRDGAASVWQALTQAGGRPAGLEAYNLLRVENGTPVYGADIDDERFVAEVGRTAQAICYTKGCYLGQEPIVMARDRGHVNRALLGLKLSGSGTVPHGAKVFRDGKEVGLVTSSVVSPALGAPVALAYLRRGNQEPGTAVEVEANAERRKAEVTGLPIVARDVK